MHAQVNYNNENVNNWIHLILIYENVDRLARKYVWIEWKQTTA